MTSSFGRARLLVNPRAGRGSVKEAWPAITRALDEVRVEHDVTFTERPGHATDTARAAVAHGCRFIAAVGGDGTVHEVVNGMMEEHQPGLVLGVVPSGSGCDFARTFGIPQDPAAAVRHLAGDGLWGALDVGRVHYKTFGGEERARWFVNIAEAGIGADVVVTAAKMTSRLGARAYRLAALKAIATFRPARVRLSMHGRKARGVKTGTQPGEMTHDGRFTMVVVANGQFFGGGLRVAPRAIPSDGMFDLLTGEGSKLDALRALRKMPSGTHVPDRSFGEYLADRVELGDGFMIEADGEALGRTPARFEIVPGAISLKI
ncbi:MAG: diacylglycerol kinase family protein [Actinomycetota bacterium]